MRRVLVLFIMWAIAGCENNGTGGGAVVAYDALPADAAAFSQLALRSRWQKSDLRYFIASFSPDLSAAEQRAVLRTAFDT